MFCAFVFQYYSNLVINIKIQTLSIQIFFFMTAWSLNVCSDAAVLLAPSEKRLCDTLTQQTWSQQIDSFKTSFVLLMKDARVSESRQETSAWHAWNQCFHTKGYMFPAATVCIVCDLMCMCVCVCLCVCFCVCVYLQAPSCQTAGTGHISV